jgi:TRAP transporter 4TM/12TM fusion protein
VLAASLGVFHLLNVSGLLLLPTVTVRIVHLTVVMTLVLVGAAQRTGRLRGIAIVGVGLAAACGIYLCVRWDAIAMSGGVTNRLDIAVGVALVALVAEATRRAVGSTLAVVTLVFLAYPFASPYLPGVLYGRGVRGETLISFLALSGDGIYGVPLGVASTYIVLFTIFGAFLSEFGAADFFFEIARFATRGLRAASAKSAVLLSTLLGMISGSAAGNVAVTGSFTIPLMKREGYAAHEAGAIEAVVSTGGQLMPPVMGAAAFIMAETLGVPYVEIMRAAVMPALLFFVSVLFVVDLLAARKGIGRPDPERGERGASGGWRAGIAFALPFLLLAGLMLAGYSPVKASLYATCSIVAVQLALSRGGIKALAPRIARALAVGVRGAVPISMACAAAGIIAAVLSVTGLGSKLSSLIVAFSGGVPLVALVLTMLTAIVLGMGLPTTAAYLMLATVVAPALGTMGVPLLTAHMFVFFYGCVSTITPPVALASYVAAGIAGADLDRVGWTAFRYGIVCYLLPFAFYLVPGLLAQGSLWSIAVDFSTGVLGVFLIAAGVVGHLRRPLRWWPRAVLLVAGALFLGGAWLGDLFGGALLAPLLLMESWQSETHKETA